MLSLAPGMLVRELSWYTERSNTSVGIVVYVASERDEYGMVPTSVLYPLRIEHYPNTMMLRRVDGEGLR